jgi:hypothetical protein
MDLHPYNTVRHNTTITTFKNLEFYSSHELFQFIFKHIFFNRVDRNDLEGRLFMDVPTSVTRSQAPC